MKKIIQRKHCPCCDGEMKSTGAMRTNSIASYIDHVCNKCGKHESYRDIFYPHEFIEFEPHEIETHRIHCFAKTTRIRS